MHKRWEEFKRKFWKLGPSAVILKAWQTFKRKFWKSTVGKYIDGVYLRFVNWFAKLINQPGIGEGGFDLEKWLAAAELERNDGVFDLSKCVVDDGAEDDSGKDILNNVVDDEGNALL